MAKESACNAVKTGDSGSIPGLGRFPGERNGNSLQYPCLQSPMDRGDWWATVQWVTKSQTRLSTSMNGGFPSGPVVKNPPAKAEDTGLISDLGRAYKLQSNEAHVPQLFSLSSRVLALQLRSSCATTTEAPTP